MAPDWTTIDWSPYLHNADVLGRRLHYLDYGAGPPMLLVHGLGGCWQWWLENVCELGAGNRVIAVDLPGFGDSEPLPAPAELAVHVQTLVALLDRLGLDRVLLVGHSMGGLISFRLALEHPERLSGLVPVGAGGVALGPRRLALVVNGFLLFNGIFSRPGVARAFALRPRLRHLLFWGVTGDPSTLSPRLAAELVPRLASPGFADAVRAAAKMANTVDGAAVATPSLLIWGERDPILPVRQARALAREMPHARIEVLPGVGHCPMFEAPTRFTEILRGFAHERAHS